MILQYQNFIFGFLISLVTTFFFVPILSKFAFKFNIVDKPDNVLKKHLKVTPYLGGVAVFLGFFISLLLSTYFNYFHLNYKIFFFFIGLFWLLIIGLIDDVFVMTPLQKLFGQFFSVLFFLKGDFFFDVGFYNFISIPLCLVWYLSVINAFNLVDVMDGLASILAITSIISFFIFAVLFFDYNLALLLISLLGSIIAFFWYNKPSAKIYLGDSGSLFLGGVLSVIPFFLLNQKLINNLNLVIGFLLILLIPLLELCFLIIIRSYKKIPFYLGSPDHFSIYLQQKGWTKAKILTYISFLAALLFIISYSYIFYYINFITLSIFTFLFFLIWSLVILY